MSSLVKLEIVESKRVEVSSVYASSASSYKLPCKALDLPYLYEAPNKNTKTNEIKWFRLNSKLPAQRHSIDSNGSLTIHGLRLSDSGMYLCKLGNQLEHDLNNNKNNYGYQLSDNIVQIEKIIKLNVIHSNFLLIKIIFL